MFFFSYWNQAFLDGLKLFELHQLTLPPRLRISYLTQSYGLAQPHNKVNRSITKPPTAPTENMSRAPHGGQALMVRETRSERPNTPGSGRRNGSRR
jgi:hypothetical protein